MRHLHTIIFVLALAMLVPAPGNGPAGAEIDSITGRDRPLDDALDALEAMFNERLRAGIEKANENPGCDPDGLYRRLRWAIHFPFIGHSIAEELNASAAVHSRRILFEESIYRDLGLLDAVSVHIKDLSAVVRMDDHLVGADKIGHFFVQGWKYFDMAYRDGEGIEAALAWGERSERTFFGLYTTGVYSYADLAANFDGMRFWLRVLGGAIDPLDRGYFFDRPYVECGRRYVLFGERIWKLERRLRLDQYVTAAWDEGQNCSEYRNEAIAAWVAGRVGDEERRAGRRLSCPMAPARCVRARERYGRYALRMLHPRCLEAQAPPQPWWRFWEAWIR